MNWICFDQKCSRKLGREKSYIFYRGEDLEPGWKKRPWRSAYSTWIWKLNAQSLHAIQEKKKTSGWEGAFRNCCVFGWEPKFGNFIGKSHICNFLGTLWGYTLPAPHAVWLSTLQVGLNWECFLSTESKWMSWMCCIYNYFPRTIWGGKHLSSMGYYCRLHWRYGRRLEGETDWLALRWHVITVSLQKISDTICTVP